MLSRGIQRGVDFVGRRWRWLLAVLLALLVIAVTLAFLVDEQLRRTMEGELNRRLVGYTVRIGQLDFHPIGFSIDLEQVTVTQDANPDPPVAFIPRLSASVQWSQIIFGRLVANFSVHEPVLYINQAHLRKEVSDEVDLEQRGWQEALQAIYPLKINEFTVRGATVTYVDDPRFPPLHLSHILVRAGNIRNIRSPERTYPSSIEAKAVVFGTGRLTITGNADFLATPFLGVKADLALESIALAGFRPVLNRYGLRLQGGNVSAVGQVEYAPWARVVALSEATVAGVHADYVRGQAAAPAPARARHSGEAVKAPAGAKIGAGVKSPPPAKSGQGAKGGDGSPPLVVRVGQFRLVDSEVGFINETVTPAYRVFVSDVKMNVTNATSREPESVAEARMSGRFMGSGAADVWARVRPAAPKNNFEINVKIENTDLRTMNDLLRAHGKFDVAAGVFSVYAEAAVRGNEVRGYVKPLFRDIKVYEREQDREKSVLRKFYERLVQGTSKLLENRPRDEVATRVDISGRLEAPDTDRLTAVLRLIQNAFFQAILPGFDHQVPRRARS